jgi:redox-sensing transcriptional repressor
MSVERPGPSLTANRAASYLSPRLVTFFTSPRCGPPRRSSRGHPLRRPVLPSPSRARVPVNLPNRPVSESTVRRLSLYLRTLEGLAAQGDSTVSSGALAERAGTSSAQVRKDLSSFGTFGTRGLGYPVERLHARIREILGLDRDWRVALVGAGRIGSALHAYPHFRERGFRIVAILDDDPRKVGRVWEGTPVRPAEELESIVAGEGIEILILAVPASAAQDLAERATAAGVRGILNFAPVRLRLPGSVEVNNVNLAVELEALSHALAGRGGEPANPGPRHR